MSPLTKGLGWIAVLSALGVGVGYGARYMNQDAFKGYVLDRQSELGAQMKNATLKVYKGGELMTDVKMGQVDIRRDRQWFDLVNIQGEAQTKEFKVDFKAERANYDAIARELQFAQGASVESKDFNLFVPALVFDEGKGELRSQAAIAGTAHGGKLWAKGITIGLEKGTFKTGPTRFVGRLPGVLQDTPVGSARTQTGGWDFRSDDNEVSSSRRNVVTFKKVQATDGEVMIRAEKGEWDRSKDVLTVTGNVYYFSEKANLVADRAVVYRREKRAVLTGNIRMLVKPKDQANLTEEIPPFRPDVPADVAEDRPAPPTPEEVQQRKDLDQALRSAENVRNYPAVVVAQGIEYWYGKGNRKAVITGSPECLQDFPGGRWRRVYAHRALYDGEAETMRLESEGNKRTVRLRTSLGDDLRAFWFLVSVKEGEDVQDWDAKGAQGKYMPTEEERQEVTPPKQDPPKEDPPKADPPKEKSGNETPPPR